MTPVVDIRRLATLAPHYTAGLAAAWALKSFYSSAGADDLAWILSPATRLAGALGGIAFTWEPRAGWVSHADGLIVGPSCAGVNFLIAAFATCYFPFVHHLSRATARAAWLPASLAASFCLTVAVNAQRILATLELRRWDVHGGLITPERAHVAAGAAIYCVALLLFHEIIVRAFRRFRRDGGGPTASPLVPTAWYLAVVLGVPILNGAWRAGPAGFLAHGALVLFISFLAAVCFIILRPRAGRAGRPGGAWLIDWVKRQTPGRPEAEHHGDTPCRNAY